MPAPSLGHASRMPTGLAPLRASHARSGTLTPVVVKRRCVTRLRTAISEAPSTTGSLPDDEARESRQFAVAMAQVADDTKASDISVLHVAPLVSWCSYMVLCSVHSRPQMLALLARVEQGAEGEWGRTKQNQPGTSPWEVLDFGDVVVHAFTPDQRDMYDLESFYAAAEEVELPFVDPALQGPQWTTRL